MKVNSVHYLSALVSQATTVKFVVEMVFVHLLMFVRAMLDSLVKIVLTRVTVLQVMETSIVPLLSVMVFWVAI
ncbi:hypothetical protein D3C80_2108910 [compost metagenome]